jgi:hypothetical protein
MKSLRSIGFAHQTALGAARPSLLAFNEMGSRIPLVQRLSHAPATLSRPTSLVVAGQVPWH